MISDTLKLLSERSDFFGNLIVQHLMISFTAILIAVIIGGLIGIYVAQHHRSSKLVIPIINFLYTIPSISMLGFLIPFSGIGNTTAVIALTIYALLPMVRSTYTGISNVDAGIIEAGRGMGSTESQLLFKIKLPLAMPIIMSGIRNMVVMTLALAGIASFIGAGGLGVAIYRGITTNNAAMTIAGSLLIALLALISDAVLGLEEKRLTRHSAIKPKRKGGIIALVALVVTTLLIATITQLNKPAGTIHIATKPMSEQYILGEMLAQLIEQDTDLKVEITNGVGGGTSNIQPAMLKGKFDLYPEYTGTAWNMVFKKQGLYNEQMFSELQKAYQKQYHLTWANMYGFNNSYGLAIRKSIADQYHLKNISDLAAISNQLNFGAEYDFYEREDGYTPLCNTYNLNFKSTADLDIGLKYQAIKSAKIDVMPIFTTDGQLSIANLTVLNDDKHFYPSYACGTVVRDEILDKYPQLKPVFAKLDNILTDAQMAELNYQVETKKKAPHDVAKAYLKQLKLIH